MARLALTILVVLLVGCGGEAAERGAVAAAPEISGTTLDGKPLSLADLRGQPVFVIVWASW